MSLPQPLPPHWESGTSESVFFPVPTAQWAHWCPLPRHSRAAQAQQPGKAPRGPFLHSCLRAKSTFPGAPACTPLLYTNSSVSCARRCGQRHVLSIQWQLLKRPNVLNGGIWGVPTFRVSQAPPVFFLLVCFFILTFHLPIHSDFSPSCSECCCADSHPPQV